MHDSTAIRRSYLDTRHGQLHYRSCGTGARSIVFIHQIASSSRMFARVMPRLAVAGWHTLAPDLHGFGQSDPPREVLSIADHAEVVSQFVDAAAQPPVVLTGHHTGARVALELAGKRPDLVSALILAGLPRYANVVAARHRLKQIGPRRIVPRPDGSHLAYEWDRIRRLSPRTSAGIIEREIVDTLLAWRYDAAYRKVFRQDVDSAADRVKCPVLLVDARRDPVFVESDRKWNRLGSARRQEMDGGVFIFDERPDAIVNGILRFLRELDG